MVAFDEATGAGVELLHPQTRQLKAPCFLVLNRLATFDRRKDVQTDADGLAFTKQLILLCTGQPLWFERCEVGDLPVCTCLS